jgi:hypothetical protein
VSAFQVSATHIAAVVGSAAAYDRSSTPDDLQELAALFAAENARSVQHRYRQPTEAVEIPSALIARYLLQPIAAAALLKAIDCLDYQSCETDDWERTPAYRHLSRLESIAKRALPGYESAPWGIDDGDAP